MRDAESDCTSAACCREEGRADYFEVARKVSISGSTQLLTQMVEMEDANVVEIDAQDPGQATTIASVTVQLEYGNDAIHWTQVSPTPSIQFQAPGSKSGVVAGISARFVRVVFRGSGRTTRLFAGIRLRTEPPILTKPVESLLPGLLVPRAGEEEAYFLLADRLSVAQASSETLPPVSMADFNAVRIEMTVIQTTSGLTIGADIEGSDDAQTWETLRSNTGIGFGCSSPRRSST
jgi:hypothetical protein